MTKHITQAALILISGITLNGGCMSTAHEQMIVEKQLTLSPGHFLMPYGISRASNGDLIVFGATGGGEDIRPWASRLSARGEARWEFVQGGTGGWTSEGHLGGRFYGVVESHDGKTLLCGIRHVNQQPRLVLDELGIDGSLLNERLIEPSRSPTTITCAKRGAEIVFAGSVFGMPRGTGWLAKLDQAFNLQWEKFSDDYGSIDLREGPNGSLDLLAWQGDRMTRIDPAGSVLARQNLPGDAHSHFAHPASADSPTTVVAMLGTYKTAVWLFDAQLRGPTHTTTLHNVGVKKCLELSDGSLAIFGSQFHNGATAAVTRVYPDASYKGFLAEPEHQSGFYLDAISRDGQNEFAATRIVSDGRTVRAVVELISFRK